MSTNVELASWLVCGHQMLAAMVELMMLEIMLAMMIKTWAIVARLRSFKPHLEFCICIYMHSHQSEGVAFTFFAYVVSFRKLGGFEVVEKNEADQKQAIGKIWQES